MLQLIMSVAENPGRNSHVDEYMTANWNGELARNIPYPAHTEPVILRGSWHEIGRQYGKRFDSYIRITYDAYYDLFLNSGLPPHRLGAILDSYMEETKKFSAEMVEFVEGVGKGASPVLNTADNANALTNTQKIMLLNSLFEVVIPPAWPHVAELMGEDLPAAPTADHEPFASHAWAAWGNMTRNQTGMMGGTRDQPWFPTLYNVSYIAIPSDEKAAVTWGNVIAGQVATSAQVNAYGVGIGNTIVSHNTQHFGVPALLATAHISFYARSAKEAADMLTRGTPEYRHRTGLETLATTVGFFQTFADGEEGFTVERTGRHFAVRTAGTQHDRGDYTVLANHAVAPYSFDDKGKSTGFPMEHWTVPEDPSSSSWSRYWALFYEFGKSRGKVTPQFAKETIAPLKHTYAADGKLVTEKDGIPVWRLGLTPERWLIPDPADPNSLATGGNNMYFVADLESRDIYWVQGIPSHWDGRWQHVSLREFDHR